MFVTLIMFSTRYPAPEKPRQKRAVIQDMVRPLKQWLLRHRHNPYPTKAEKLQLAVGSNMTLVQVRLTLRVWCLRGGGELSNISVWWAQTQPSVPAHHYKWKLKNF